MIINPDIIITDKILLKAMEECNFTTGLVFRTKYTNDDIVTEDINSPLESIIESIGERDRLIMIETISDEQSMSISRPLIDIYNDIIE